MSILIVDDAATDRLALVQLNDAGYADVLLAGSAVEAIACLAQRSPDDVELILTDLHMPEVDGITVTVARWSHTRYT
jgi:CheY-like chemotaxis protein